MQQHTYAIMNRAEDSHWWYVGRRAILESFLRDIVQNIKSESQNPKILDVGCGTGGNLEMLAKFGAAEGVDVSDEALEFCKSKGLKAHKGLAEMLPFPNESFDVVTALDVVEHLDDDIAGLREMYRVLKIGGKTLIFVPAFMWLWGVQDDVSNHRIRYTKKQIVERLRQAGFEIERATYANWTFFAPILAGRTLMKITGIKPESENNVNVSALNGIFGKIFGAEKLWLKNFDFPFGVSIVVVAKKTDVRGQVQNII
ncbi:MAG TPA: class I SAM-dependent methyltransferase [Pyrinomonadaceae bacterium]|jgi:SAM-dependent methyltransferase